MQLLSHTAVMNKCAQNFHDSMGHPHLLAQLGKDIPGSLSGDSETLKPPQRGR